MKPDSVCLPTKCLTTSPHLTPSDFSVLHQSPSTRAVQSIRSHRKTYDVTKVIIVALSLLARNSGECLTNHSLPALFGGGIVFSVDVSW